MSKRSINRFFNTAISIIFLVLSGCSKLVEVDPSVNFTNGDNLYNSDATAIAAITGVYTKMSEQIQFGISSLSILPALSADELTLFGGVNNAVLANYYRNALTNSNDDYWNSFYPVVYTLNSALEGITAANALTPKVKKQLLGEAHFMRAFSYFYLVNLYGDVPLALTSDYTQNGVLSRTPKEQVYKQIEIDLKEASSLLSEEFLNGTLKISTIDRLRPTKWAAIALLSRVYLYEKDWVNAQASATAIIDNSGQFDLVQQLDNVFLANSNEAIWQLQPVNNGENTPDAKLFILPESGPQDSYPVYLSPQLLRSFQPGDLRKSHWVDSVIVTGVTYHYPYKYKVSELYQPITEYKMVMRLAEQFLIRSEAYVQQGNAAAAVKDLNRIRNRAGLLDYVGAMDKASLLMEVDHQRQDELFTEWGDRWLNLKRRGTIDAVMSKVTSEKGGVWKTEWEWYPVPFFEIQSNPKIIQNTGY